MVPQKLSPRLHHTIKVLARVTLPKGKDAVWDAIDRHRLREDGRGPDDIDSTSEVWKQCLDLHRAMTG
jgi:hypothetical protein